MIFKHTVGGVADNSGVWSVFVFHLYKGFNRKSSGVGDYVRISVRDTKPNNWLAKKTKKKALILRTKKEVFIRDGSSVFFSTNSLVILKKRLTSEGSEISGPMIRVFKKKKFLASLPGVI